MATTGSNHSNHRQPRRLTAERLRIDVEHLEDASDSTGIGEGSTPVDLPRIERAVREILIAVGEDPDREGLVKTPNRVARSYVELLGGMRIQPKRYLQTVFQEKYDQLVLLRHIPFHSLCEHHMLPFTGFAHIAYLPRNRVVGLSKLARLVEAFALRLQVQERLTDQIADALMEGLNPRGAICVLQATHTCMTMRGVKKPGASMVTSAVRGVFLTSAKTRAEAFAHIYNAGDLGG